MEDVISKQEYSDDIFYECHICKKLVPGSISNAINDPIVMVREKPNSPTFLFECFDCHN